MIAIVIIKLAAGKAMNPRAMDSAVIAFVSHLGSVILSVLLTEAFAALGSHSVGLRS